MQVERAVDLAKTCPFVAAKYSAFLRGTRLQKKLRHKFVFIPHEACLVLDMSNTAKLSSDHMLTYQDLPTYLVV